MKFIIFRPLSIRQLGTLFLKEAVPSHPVSCGADLDLGYAM